MLYSILCGGTKEKQKGGKNGKWTQKKKHFFHKLLVQAAVGVCVPTLVVD
jgi:hypothetical protein